MLFLEHLFSFFFLSGAADVPPEELAKACMERIKSTNNMDEYLQAHVDQGSTITQGSAFSYNYKNGTPEQLIGLKTINKDTFNLDEAYRTIRLWEKQKLLDNGDIVRLPASEKMVGRIVILVKANDKKIKALPPKVILVTGYSSKTLTYTPLGEVGDQTLSLTNDAYLLLEPKTKNKNLLYAFLQDLHNGNHILMTPENPFIQTNFFGIQDGFFDKKAINFNLKGKEVYAREIHEMVTNSWHRGRVGFHTTNEMSVGNQWLDVTEGGGIEVKLVSKKFPHEEGASHLSVRDADGADLSMHVENSSDLNFAKIMQSRIGCYVELRVLRKFDAKPVDHGKVFGILTAFDLQKGHIQFYNPMDGFVTLDKSFFKGPGALREYAVYLEQLGLCLFSRDVQKSRVR